MLGHVSRSVGSALPGNVAPLAFLGQTLAIPTTAGTQTINGTVPADSEAVFVEVLARGGDGTASAGAATIGGGGGASDAIVATSSGAAFAITFNADGSVSASISGTTAASATAGAANGSAGAGKYPGTNSGSGAAGGGRLGGRASTGNGTVAAYIPPGSGGRPSTVGANYSVFGGNAIAVLTFFRTRDAALAYANSLYGGAWAP